MVTESTVIDGVEVEIERKRPLEDGGVRIDVTADETRTWRLDLQPDGEYDLVTSWYDDQLADVAIPDWMDDLLGRIAVAA